MSRFRVESEESIRALCNQPDVVAYTGTVLRPGLYAWMVELEYTKYVPDTDANEDLHLFFSEGAFGTDSPDAGGALTMVTVVIPRSGMEFAESILWKHGLRKCSEGCIPVIIDSKGVHKFFLSGPNIFYLENHSDGAQNVIYTNDPVKMKSAWKHEKQQAKKFFDEHKAWLETPEGLAIAQAYWAKHPELNQ